MAQDPGYVPKLAGMTQQKAIIDELLVLWKYDAENFCTLCMVRKPLRSKHCKECGRCVAKHDQYAYSRPSVVPYANGSSHCPWTYNCVGVNNHRNFLFYLVFMEIGVIALVRLTYTCKSD